MVDTKTRFIDKVPNLPYGRSGTRVAGTKVLIGVHLRNNQGVESRTSEGHPWPPSSRSRSRPLDIGGPFALIRRTFRSTPFTTSLISDNGFGYGYWYDGEIHASTVGKTYGVSDLPAKISTNTLNVTGTAGIARFNPVRPHGGLSQFLGELHDLPKLITVRRFRHTRSTLRFFKDLGGAYLNIEFGWKPFVRDLQDAFQNALDSDKILRQLARDNGRTVRRKGILEETETNSVNTSTGFFTAQPGYTALYGSGVQTQVRTVKFRKKRWFSGQFRYHIPVMTRQSPFWTYDAFIERQRLARIVYGADLSPETIWNLIPWSWLGDWAGNVGDIMANASSASINGLTVDYAYAMHSQENITETVVSGNLKSLGSDVPFRCHSEDISESKGRSRANPYGFGISFPDLSTERIAILAALGLSRLRD